MSTTNFSVIGMSCGHCAASVREELTAVPGVREVWVNVSAGSVTVEGADLDEVHLRTAIAAAGYEVVAPVTV